MKIVIDPTLCEGNERCANAAPEIFEVRDDRAHLLIERPPARLLDKIRLAVRMCPRQAISIIDDDAQNN